MLGGNVSREELKAALDRIVLLGHMDPAFVVETAKAARHEIRELEDEVDEIQSDLDIIHAAEEEHIRRALERPDAFPCPDCKHTHNGRLGGICVGCPCPRTSPVKAA